MFDILYTVQQMEPKHLLIPSDISHKVHTQDLIKQDQRDMVKAI